MGTPVRDPGSGVQEVASMLTGSATVFNRQSPGNTAAQGALVTNTSKVSVTGQSPTLTAAQLVGGYVEHVSATGAGVVTLDTAANLDTAYTPAPATGDSFYCLFVNTGNQTDTITTNTGLTLKGSTVAITTLKSALLWFRRTGAAAWDVFILASS